jgi:hypothetical protein
LDKNCFEVKIRRGLLSIHDVHERLIVKVPRSPNRLYKLTFRPVQPVCLAAQYDSTTLQWHAHFGHLHFDVMQKMVRGDLVN